MAECASYMAECTWRYNQVDGWERRWQLWSAKGNAARASLVAVSSMLWPRLIAHGYVSRLQRVCIDWHATCFET